MFFANKTKLDTFTQMNTISRKNEKYYCEIEKIEVEETNWQKVLKIYLTVHGDGSLQEFPSPLGSILWTGEEQGIGCLPEDPNQSFIGYKIMEQDAFHLKAILSYDLKLFLEEDETATVENRLFFSYGLLQSGFSKAKLNLPNIQPWSQPTTSFFALPSLTGTATTSSKKITQSFIQPENAISRKSDNLNYYVIIHKVDLEYDENDPNRITLRIDLTVHGDGSLGPVPSPLQSLLWIGPGNGREGFKPIIIERNVHKIHAICAFVLLNRSDRRGLMNNLLTFQYGCAYLNFQPVALIADGFIYPDGADEELEEELDEEEEILEDEVEFVGNRNNEGFDGNQMKGAGNYSSFRHISKDVLRLDDGFYLITFVVGENGCDGHGKSNVYGIKSNIPPIELRSSYQQGVERLGYDITRYCQEYEDHKIHSSFQKALRLKGFVVASSSLSFRNDEDTSLEYIDAKIFLQIFLFTVRLGNPSFVYSKVTMPSFEIGGYGLYY